MEAAERAVSHFAIFILQFAICNPSSLTHFSCSKLLGSSMTESFRESDLEAFLNEALPAEESSRIERALRGDAELSGGRAIHARRDAGVHSLGKVWRRHRLSCPSREELGGFLLGALAEATADYIAFHVETAGCRYCQANLADLEDRRAGAGRSGRSPPPPLFPIEPAIFVAKREARHASGRRKCQVGRGECA